MYQLIRPHHSFYMMREDQYEDFIYAAKENRHMSALLYTDVEDILFTWRIAFNIWQYLVNDDQQLIVNPEMRMIYPSTAFILDHTKQNQEVTRFRTHYKQNQELVFHATILITNALFFWCYESCTSLLKESVEMHPFLKSDFYMLYQEKKNSADGYPIEFAQRQTAILKLYIQAAHENAEELQQALKEAIEESKQYFSYFEA